MILLTKGTPVDGSFKYGTSFEDVAVPPFKKFNVGTKSVLILVLLIVAGQVKGYLPLVAVLTLLFQPMKLTLGACVVGLDLIFAV